MRVENAAVEQLDGVSTRIEFIQAQIVAPISTNTADVFWVVTRFQSKEWLTLRQGPFKPHLVSESIVVFKTEEWRLDESHQVSQLNLITISIIRQDDVYLVCGTINISSDGIIVRTSENAVVVRGH